MRIYICVKQVPDTETKIKLRADQSGIDEAGVKWIMNPYDEFAVEEALKLKEASGGTPTVTVVSVGPKRRTVDTIRTALAMGADDGIAVDAPETIDSYLTAKALAAAINSAGGCDLVFSGKLAIDDNAASVSQQVAEFLGVPHTTVVSKFSFAGGVSTLEREVEGGTRELVQLSGCAVVGANKGLNMPRYASLPGIMKAKKKPIKEVSLAELGLSEVDVRVKYSNFSLPPEKPPVKMLAGDPSTQAKELARLLREEAKVI